LNRYLFWAIAIYFSFVSIFTTDVAAPFLEKEILRILDINEDFASYVYLAAVLFSGLAFGFAFICFINFMKHIKSRTK